MMNLPNYFLADLPQEATLGAPIITEACQTLKRNRQRYLAERPLQSLIAVLSNLARDWLEAEFSFRKLALEHGPEATGFSRATLQRGLDSFFKSVSRESLSLLVEQDLGHAQRLEDLVAGGPEQKLERASIATGPELLAHFTAGNMPSAALSSMVLGLLVRSAQFVKCASGASLLPRLFAHSLYQLEPKLASCLEIAEWRGGNAPLEEALFAETDCVTATGSDEALAAIRQRVPSHKRFIAYGNRVSFGYVAGGVLSGLNAQRVAGRAAADITAWDQLGCLSPHVIYVQSGGATSAEQFAELLSEQLALREESEPRGKLSVEAAAAIASRRSFYEVRAANSQDTRLFSSKDSTASTVVFEADARFQLSCLNRFVYVKIVKDLSEALQNTENVRGKVSTVGLAVPEDKAQEHVKELARWGVTRVCQLGRMQNPSLAWRHDGRPALAELVTWTDWEL